MQLQKRLFFAFFIILLASITACSEDKTESLPPVLTGITLFTEEVVLGSNAQGYIDFSISPADADILPTDFTLVSTATGAAPTCVTVGSARRLDNGSMRLPFNDNGRQMKYNEEVKVVCTKTEVSSSALMLRSRPYMPVVRITTTQEVTSKDIWVDGTMEIDGGNGFDDLEQCATQIKGRGNTTWNWEKKPYALKLSQKKTILGMPAHKRWCLIANYMDRTLLRNRIAYYIGQHSNLAWTVRNEFAEVYFNGTYQGCYLLTEQIKIDKNRLDITEMTPADNNGEALTGGYLLELDGYFDEVNKFRSVTTYLPVNIKSPEEELTSEQFDYIQRYFNAADASVFAADSSDPETGFRKYFDEKSLIDYWIISEIMANHEPLNPKSAYFYKARSGKLTAGPIWDFDYETLVVHTQRAWMLYDKTHTMMENQPSWWYVFLQDAAFRQAAKQRWNEWYPFLKRVSAYIEEQRTAIANAERRNNQRWPNINDTGNPNRDEQLSFDESVNQLKSVYNIRLEWMNDEIGKW